MQMLYLFYLTALIAVNARLVRRNAKNEYKMCVPEELIASCQEMSLQETKSSAKIICIPARDRIDCIDKIQKRLADFVAVDPEDMYVAGKLPENEFRVFEEIRTREEPDAEFRYEGVAVIHKDLEINNIQEGLKGLRSCHTGIGRNVGYKIPLTKLKNMNIIGKLNDPNMSPRENELFALSTLFSKACIVGQWSPDPTVNTKLKKEYSSLCALCENPEKCDYPDLYSGYEGALRCLIHNGGQIAWTKVIYVKKFFGLPVGITAARNTTENPDDYAYLCPDGTRVPVRDTPCRWAARPWQGYMTNAAIIKNIDELRKKIENLNSVGTINHSKWLQKVLEISDKNIAKENKVISPKDYLDKANYSDVIESEYGPPIKVITLCVISQDEFKKCRSLSDAAFSRNVRPRFDCVLDNNCLKLIRDGGADIITLRADQLKLALDFNLKPIIKESYDQNGSNYVVAVVKKVSGYQSFGDLKGAKSCHTSHPVSGYYAVLNTLINLNLLKRPPQCSAEEALTEFFSGSCLPGAYSSMYNFQAAISGKLCSICKGTGDSKCTIGKDEPYYNNAGVLQCLQESGDVAFIESHALSTISDLSKNDYELICPNGGKATLDQFYKCNLLEMPPNMIVTRRAKSDNNIEEIQNALLSVSNIYQTRPDWFRMFGEYNGKSNLLFSDTTKGLISLKDEEFSMETITKIINKSADFCY